MEKQKPEITFYLGDTESNCGYVHKQISVSYLRNKNQKVVVRVYDIVVKLTLR